MRARLHVKGTDLGFYREGTHELCDPRSSRQLLPETLDVLAAVSAALKDAGITDGRALELSENRAATERALYLEMAGSARGQAGFEALLDLPGATGVGIARAGVPIAAAGSPIVADELVLSSATGQAEPVRLQRHVTGFFQGNRFLLQTLVDRVLAQVPEGPMADLYAGAGLFGVAHAASGRGEVIAVEGDPASIEDLQANAAPYPAACTSRRGPSKRHSGIVALSMVGPLSSIPHGPGCRARPSRPWRPPDRPASCTCPATWRLWPATPPRLPRPATIW